VSITSVSEDGIELFRSIPSGPLVYWRVPAGRVRVEGKDSYGLHLGVSEPFEIEDPSDQIGLLANPPQATASEPA
jgi:hypothetical protein